MEDPEKTFEAILRQSELKKVDFKEKQYRLDNDLLKSKFIKDILCMANTPGGDGYILLGVRNSDRKVVGVTSHHDSAMLESLVGSVVEEPIDLEYYQIKCESEDCALLHIPVSNARPHWAKKDFGNLRKHIFYTRRSSGNREASFAEIREMFLSSIRVSEVARRKPISTAKIVDELAEFDVSDRTLAMYDMLRKAVRQLSLHNYVLVSNKVYGTGTGPIGLFTAGTGNSAKEYAVFMYPLSVRRDDIIWSHASVSRILKPPYYGRREPASSKSFSIIQRRLDRSTFVHIAYNGIYTTALERGRRDFKFFWFENRWKEPWGEIIKWNSFNKDKTYYEFFVPNVTSQLDFAERLTKLLAWADTHC